jgi:hypothetical protein
MPEKKSDLVVWSEERGWYAKSLPYGSNLSAPAFRPESLAGWAVEGVIKTQHYFESEMSGLQRRYEQLRNEWEWNERVYASAFRFEPVVGKTYYLYEDESGEFLSLIEPSEWYKVCIGATRMNGGRRWERVEK